MCNLVNWFFGTHRATRKRLTELICHSDQHVCIVACDSGPPSCVSFLKMRRVWLSNAAFRVVFTHEDQVAKDLGSFCPTVFNLTVKPRGQLAGGGNSYPPAIMDFELIVDLFQLPGLFIICSGCAAVLTSRCTTCRRSVPKSSVSVTCRLSSTHKSLRDSRDPAAYCKPVVTDV